MVTLDSTQVKPPGFFHPCPLLQKGWMAMAMTKRQSLRCILGLSFGVFFDVTLRRDPQARWRSSHSCCFFIKKFKWLFARRNDVVCMESSLLPLVQLTRQLHGSDPFFFAKLCTQKRQINHISCSILEMNVIHNYQSRQ